MAGQYEQRRRVDGGEGLDGKGWTVQGWTVRQARLRTSREPAIEAMVTDPAARLIDLDRSVWPDTSVDPGTIPLVQCVVEHAETCRAERAVYGPEHLSPACHRVGPVLQVLPGGGELERREDAG